MWAEPRVLGLGSSGPVWGGRTQAEGLGVVGEEGEVTLGLRRRWDIRTAVGRGQLGRWLWRRGEHPG